jgi:hypothetical protein
MYTSWEVWLNGTIYDTVRFHRDADMFTVRNSLIKNYGYPENIILIFAK